MKNRIMKRLIAGLCVVALAVAAVVVTPNTAKAAETDARDIAWVEYTNTEFKDLYNANKTAPTYEGENQAEGYVFGGWYTEKDGEALTETTAAAATGNVVAKFVPSYVLNVKTQNGVEYTEGEGESAVKRTNIRVVAAVDSTKYAEVGFKYVAGNKGMGDTVVANVKQEVYTSLKAEGKTVYPTDLMGPKANYFISHRFTRIKSTSYASIIYVRPYWKTLDGTVVEGLGKYVHVEDGKNNYVSVPVTLYEAKAIAAGVAEITYDKDKLTFLKDKTETGRVFEEMAWADKDGSVKVVGNVEKIESNATNPNDIFVSLRFQKKVADENLHGALKFEVKRDSIDFCDILEDSKDLNIWNIRY